MTNNSRHINLGLPDLRVSRRSATMNLSVVPTGGDILPSDPRHWDQPTPEHCDTVRMLGMLLCVGACLGTLFNGILVFSFIRHKNLLSPQNVYILFISIMGLIASCTILPLTGTSSVYCRWLYKRLGCQLSAMMAFLYGCSSSYLLCVVSLGRCYIIIRPFRANQITVERSMFVSCLVVLIALILSMLPMLGWNEYVMEGIRTSCCINWYDRRLSYVSFTFFLFIFVYCLPLLILVVSNTITMISLKVMRERLAHGCPTAMNKKRLDMEKRIVKNIIVTTAGFLFTWTPYAITLFLSAFRGKEAAVPSLITFSCACFAKSSTIWIPLLYMSTSTQFKLRFLAADVAESAPLIGNSVKRPTIHQLVVVHNQDGSIIVQTATQAISKNKRSLPTSNQPLIEPDETLRSEH